MIQPKKSLGQHFLTNRQYCTRILELAGINHSDMVLEIGPGTGFLTSALLQNSRFVTALEFDRDMISFLGEKFHKEIHSAPPRLRLHQENVLKADWRPLLSCFPGTEESPPETESPKTKVIGNLPYNISTRILEYSIRFKELFNSFTFMAQKEVAMRILAGPGTSDYGYFSLLMEFNFQRIKGFDVSPGAFSPPPGVMSHVMQLKPRFIEVPSPGQFVGLIKKSFAQRRKTIFNNLKPCCAQPGKLSEILEACGIPENARPQEISLEQFLAVSEAGRTVLSFKP